MLSVLTLYKLERISRPLINGLLFFYAAYHFDMPSFAVLSSFYLFYSTIANISTLGIEGYVKRESNDQDFLEKTSALMFLRIVIAVLVSVIVFCVYSNEVQWKAMAVLLLVLVIQPIDSVEWEVVAQHRYKVVCKSRIISSGACFSVKLIGLALLSPLVFIASHIVEQLLQVKTLYRYIPKRHWPAFKEVVGLVNGEVCWYFLSVLLIVVWSRLDQYYVLKFFGGSQLSVYALAVAVLQIPILLISNLYVKRYNSILKLMGHRSRFAKWYRLYAKVFVLTGGALVVLITGVVQLFDSWVNYKYSNLSLLIFILCPIVLFTAIALIQTVYWLYVKKSYVFARLQIMGGGLTIAAFSLFAADLSLEQVAFLSMALNGATSIMAPLFFKDGRDMYRLLLSK